MTVEGRPHHEGFLEDVKRILGDIDGVVNSRPSRAQFEEYKQLCVLLWGKRKGSEVVIPELQSKLKDHLRTQTDQLYEIRYAGWGEQILEYLPWPKRVPKCRIWFVKENDGIERLITMTDVTTTAEGYFPDLNDSVIPRIQDEYPGSCIEQEE